MKEEGRRKNQFMEIANTAKELFCTDLWYMAQSIELYNDRFKQNGWVIYFYSRRASGLSGFQGGKEERGEEGLYQINHEL